jgi:hypothetical protein
MSLLDKASLIVTPNAYKESKLYSVVPSDGSGDMTVVRATTATRINSANLVEVVPRNLLTYSQDLSSGYTLNQCTNTSSQTAFDGTSNARRITNGATATDPYFEQSVSFAPTTYTWSVYVKQGTAAAAAIKPVHVGIGGDVSLMTFTFATETIVTSGAITTSGFTKLTNGWYRIYCSVNITSSVSSLRGRFGNPNVANVYNDWAYPQLEARTSASEFLPTTTRLNIPRIDYTNGSCPSLLVEPQRTNLLTYSEQFDDASWTKFQATVTANNTTSPQGISTADKLESSTNGTAVLFRTALTGATASTISVYAKAGTNDVLDIGFTNITDFTVKANLTTGTITSATSGITGTITNVGNGWYRVTATRTMTASGTAFINSATNISGRFIYIWGAQLEVGSYATSYIPTVASTVTRNADVISNTNILLKNSWSFFLNSRFDSAEFDYSAIYIQDLGGGTIVGFYADFRNVISYSGFAGNFVNPLPLFQYNKCCYKYDGTNLKLFKNGTLVFNEVRPNIEFKKIFIQGGNPKASLTKTKELVLFNTALTDTECITLTTL